MVITPDNQYLFMGDRNGDVNQLSIDSNKIIKTYPKLHSCILSITISKDGKYIFTSCCFDHK